MDFEPRHALVVDVVRLVVEDGEFFDFADEFAEVGLRVGGLAGGLFAEGVGEEVVAQVVVGGKPAVLGNRRRVGQSWKLRVQGRILARG